VKAWHGTDNDTSKAITNTVTMNASRTVTVDFEAIPIITYALNASVSSGYGTVSPTSGTYTQGTVVSLTATPDSSYRVKAWHGTDNDTSKATTNSVTMNNIRTVTVEFEAIPVTTYTLSTSVIGGHGVVSPPSGTYNQGAVVTLTTTPESGYRAKSWNGTDNDSSKEATNSVTMNTNRVVSVEFEIIPGSAYTLNASVLNGHGTITISPSSGPYPQGTVVTLSATPESGYKVLSWKGTDNDTSTSSSNSVTMNANSTVTVEFTGSANAEENTKKGSGGGGGGGCFISTASSDDFIFQSLLLLIIAGMAFECLYRKYFYN
jgi:hypothetical protein